MARIYSSRLLLDPSVLQMANAAMQNRIANETALRKWVGQSVGSGLQSTFQNLGGMADSAYQSYKNQKDQAYRRDQINNFMSAEQLSDPFMRATAEEYIRTGDAGKMTQYMLGKEAAEARREAAAQSAQEKADNKSWHEGVRAAQAQESYAKNLKGYNESKTQSERLQYLLANQALEKQFGNIFGQTMEEYEQARDADRSDAIIKEAQKKKIDDASYNVKNWIRENIIPLGSIRTKKDQTEIADFIRNSKGLTEYDRKELLDDVLKNKTQAEKVKTAQQEAVAAHAGKETTKKVDEAEAKKRAMEYVGKKMNSLQFGDIPNEIRQYLELRGNGEIVLK